MSIKVISPKPSSAIEVPDVSESATNYSETLLYSAFIPTDTTIINVGNIPEGYSDIRIKLFNLYKNGNGAGGWGAYINGKNTSGTYAYRVLNLTTGSAYSKVDGVAATTVAFGYQPNSPLNLFELATNVSSTQMEAVDVDFVVYDHSVIGQWKFIRSYAFGSSGKIEHYGYYKGTDAVSTITMAPVSGSPGIASGQTGAQTPRIEVYGIVR